MPKESRIVRPGESLRFRSGSSSLRTAVCAYAYLDEYLDWCYANQTGPRVDELAKFAGMSPSVFSRKFRHLCGEPPSKALKRAQLDRAQQLLADSNNLAVVAYAAAYGTRRTLYRSFKRMLGTTPRRAVRNRVSHSE